MALINDAEKAGKVSFKDDADKAKAIESAIANYEGFKAMVDGIQPQKPEKKNAAVSIPDAEGKKHSILTSTLQSMIPRNWRISQRMTLNFCQAHR